MDPISRSAKPFCHGERGATGLSRMPIARRRCLTTEPKTRSRVRIRSLGDSGLRDLEAELEKLAMDARRAPEWVIQAHPPDERAQVRIDLRAPSSIPGLPAPVAAKPSTMPAN